MATITTLDSTSYRLVNELLDPKLQRQIRSELNTFNTILEQWKFNDKTSRKMRKWLECFKADFQTSRCTQERLNRYIGLMQKILVDDVSGAPLDENALLGTFGEVLGQITCVIHKNTTPAPYNERSPLFPKRDVKFETIPHTLARAGVNWLKAHHACLYSVELENAYLRLIPRQAPKDTKTKVEKLREKFIQEEKEKVQAKARAMQAVNQATSSQSRNRMQALMQKIHSKLSKVEEQHQQKLEAVETRMQEMREEQRRDFQELHQEQEAIRARYEKDLEWMQEQLAQADSESRAALEQLQDKLTKLLYDFDVLAEDIVGFSTSYEEFELLKKSNEEKLAALRESIDMLYQDALEQEEEIARFGGEILETTKQVEQLEQEEAALERKLENIERDIERHKRESSNSVFSTIAIIGTCMFGGWALSAIGFTKIAFVPVAGGAMAVSRN